MKIPSRVKIGGHWFKIVYKDDDKDDYRLTGGVTHWQNKIFLQTQLTQSKRESVLIHEIIEEISSQNDLKIEHHILSCLAERIYQVLVDNKWLK